jgi:hypothetical protein
MGAGAGRVDEDEGLARLALLWSERAAALRFRRAVLAMTAHTPEALLDLARIQREAFAYDAGAARLRAVRPSRIGWLIRVLQSRGTDRVVGAALATMSAELSVLLLAARLAEAREAESKAATDERLAIAPRSA